MGGGVDVVGVGREARQPGMVDANLTAGQCISVGNEYRDLKVGDKGPDAAALNEALDALSLASALAVRRIVVAAPGQAGTTSLEVA